MSPALHIELATPGWVTHGGTSARGEAHLDGKLHSASDLARVFDAAADEQQWRRTLCSCNGTFAVVSRRADAVLAAVDRIRSIPLFHCNGSGTARLSDVAERALGGANEVSANPDGDVEFGLTGYVTGDETLVSGLRQIQAGESLRFDVQRPAAPTAWRYHAFEHGNYFTTGEADLIDRLGVIHESVFRRLAESAGGRQIAVPLSGGYDSRLIGVSLRDLGVRDVVCYSYGLPGNWESRISAELARYLGFRWEFVPYSAERWRQWAASERFAAYFRAAGNLASVPHVQDWPAVWELDREHKVAPDAVFVPGHSGDFLAGSHIPLSFLATPTVRRDAFFDTLLQAHYSLWEWLRGTGADLRETFTRRVEAIVGPVGDVDGARAADLFERWDLQERQAKFICNSVRAYEHFGHEWRLPLFDHELMDFWARVPAPLRVGRKLYYEYVRQRQQLPVTTPNTDRGSVQGAIVRGIAAAGLKPLAKQMRRRYRAWRWRDAYLSSSLGWLSIVDEDFFRRTYTGGQIFHSYLARAYRNWALAESQGEVVVPGLGAKSRGT